MKLTITINVTYDDATISDHTKIDVLSEFRREIERGMLSPLGDEVIDEYSLEIKQLEGN
jgi:hypothetical protein